MNTNGGDPIFSSRVLQQRMQSEEDPQASIMDESQPSTGKSSPGFEEQALHLQRRFKFRVGFLISLRFDSFSSSSSPPSVTMRRSRRPHLLSSQVFIVMISLSHSHLDLYGWLSLNLPVAVLFGQLAITIVLFGLTSQPIEHETSLQSMVFQLAAHPPFPASDKGWGKELGQM
ncbi:hypothetical protein Prudu_019314 [Prunus dulcis]|uniref:Uncharacterized protein n=1 Tax=Prunus dulcis TaxID=3755 RepID=A0A4Y1RSS1_PRUDU|nr:hypothetical protein Prudu_019314 [Prunus dulcis]